MDGKNISWTICTQLLRYVAGLMGFRVVCIGVCFAKIVGLVHIFRASC